MALDQTEGETAMLDHLLSTAQAFERTHGVTPDVVYINPRHYENLRRHCPELFDREQEVELGFRLVILPGSLLTHPEAARLTDGPGMSHVA